MNIISYEPIHHSRFFTVHGNDLLQNEAYPLSVLTIVAILDVNQHASAQRQVVAKNEQAIWESVCGDKMGKNLAMFNLANSSTTIQLIHQRFAYKKVQHP